jgi:hypothetical protein
LDANFRRLVTASSSIFLFRRPLRPATQARAPGVAARPAYFDEWGIWQRRSQRSDNELPGAAARQRRRRAVRSNQITASCGERGAPSWQGDERGSSWRASRDAPTSSPPTTNAPPSTCRDDAICAPSWPFCASCYALKRLLEVTHSAQTPVYKLIIPLWDKCFSSPERRPTRRSPVSEWLISGNCRDENGGYFVITTRVRQLTRGPRRGVPRPPSGHSKTAAGWALLALAHGAESSSEIPPPRYANTCFTRLSVIL